MLRVSNYLPNIGILFLEVPAVWSFPANFNMPEIAELYAPCEKGVEKPLQPYNKKAYQNAKTCPVSYDTR